MNTSKIKAYAPQARRDFIRAVTERANLYGIFDEQKIEPVEIKGDVAIIGGRAFPRKEGQLREKLVSRIQDEGFRNVMEAYAYTWFNRFVALRYMELHDYLEHGFRVLSNRSGGSDIPEILEHAADVTLEGLQKDKVIELRLAGHKDNELYRLLLVAQCNALHQAMPFLFDRIDSETELLLPDNLLHSNSPIRKLVNDIDEQSWQDVEIIGWMYQFYISEKKDQVIGKVVKSEDIPAATQLFTPNWIVKYMVQNTLGRMWLASYPDSALREKMDYYIEPAEQEPDVQQQLDAITPKELHPEEITFFDPACGSGHILIEAYAIFKEIYLERGYRTRDIPRLILEKNLFGLDICDRAAQLACFAVLMKARQDDRRILGRDDLKLNVMAIQESDASDLKNIDIFFQNNDGVKDGLKELVRLFEQAKTFGSLISVPEHLVGKREQFETAIHKNLDGLFRFGNFERLTGLLRQTEILEKKYDCVVTNPPYMGSANFNPPLKAGLRNRFKITRTDLYAIFLERSIGFVLKNRFLAMITMQSWMFTLSYNALRENIIKNFRVANLVQLGPRAFETISGEIVATTMFCIQNTKPEKSAGIYIRITDGDAREKEILFRSSFRRFSFRQRNFLRISGSPMVYWKKLLLVDIFEQFKPVGDLALFREGIHTANNEKFLREWWEINFSKFSLNETGNDSIDKNSTKWIPYNKGGGNVKWYGNYEYAIAFDKKSREEMSTLKGHVRPSQDIYFKHGGTWSDIGTKGFGVKYYPNGFLFDTKGPVCVGKDITILISGLNSAPFTYISELLMPTISYKCGTVKTIPFPNNFEAHLVEQIGSRVIAQSRNVWNFYEFSWDFNILPFIQSDYYRSTLKASYNVLRAHWQEITTKMQHFEKENNRIFIEAYGLQDELTPDVPLSEITLTCNPYYRYGSNKSDEELETLLLTDTIKELISYAIGCMMGRYSLDRPGLIYAHSGNNDFEDIYHRKGAKDAKKDIEKKPLRSLRLCGEFTPDEDGIIPIMDQEWFADDATHRFIQFLKMAWSTETLDENLKFVADSLKPRTHETPVDTIRRYLSAGFFKDHLKTYKKRPIYWLFSSGKHKAFQCLVYLHRYNESTLSRMRSSYVTPLQGHFSARIEFLQHEKDAAATASAQRKIQKEIELMRKKQEELRTFDDELRHYADMKISLDLDDGVKVNYGKFGNLLAEKNAVTGKK